MTTTFQGFTQKGLDLLRDLGRREQGRQENPVSTVLYRLADGKETASGAVPQNVGLTAKRSRRQAARQGG